MENSTTHIDETVDALMQKADIIRQANMTVDQAIERYPDLKDKKQEIFTAWVNRLTAEANRDL